MIHLLLAIIYISFISLGLPDGLLGSAWPSMYTELNVPVSYAGVLSMVISAGTVVSALGCERIVKRFGTGIVTASSVAMTAVALLGFARSTEFWQLCLLSIPYGLGAGSVDAALNNFVALHYNSRQMSWLHCFWGVGCTTGPYIMSYFLINGGKWGDGYFAVFILQLVLTIMIIFSLPLWKQKEKMNGNVGDTETSEVLGIKRTVTIKGVKQVMLTFFCYCALEQTAGLWAVSYVVLEKGMQAEEAARLGAIFYIGITVGRFLSGILTAKFSDIQMVRLGQVIILVGIIPVVLPVGIMGTIVGMVLIGLGCAPIYPCLIHATPAHFGSNASQAVIGLQMASAYVGTTLMPPVFGFLADHLGIGIFPLYLIVLLVVMVWFSESLVRKTVR